jgi:hypothetical protein
MRPGTRGEARLTQGRGEGEMVGRMGSEGRGRKKEMAWGRLDTGRVPPHLKSHFYHCISLESSVVLLTSQIISTTTFAWPFAMCYCKPAFFCIGSSLAVLRK